MKCNKCGTPIIPGESTCRICGNKADFSKRVKEPEIIDFPEEIEEKVEVKEVVSELPDLVDIVDIEDVKPEEPVLEVVDIEEPINENQEEVETVVELPQEPQTDLEQTMSLEPEVVETISEEEGSNKVEEVPSVEEPIVKETKPSKKKVLDKANEKEVKSKKEKKVKKETKTSSNVLTVLLSILLIGSLCLNVYLFIMDGNSKASGNNDNNETAQTYSKTAYNNYKINMPSSWITENTNNGLLIYDDSQNWSANMQMISEGDYDTFVTNKESLVASLGNKKYQFTSNYSKQVEEKDFYLFKGKYYDYSVYVIVTELDDNMLVVDLKFKGEVDDVLLNNILKAMTEVKEKNTANLFKDNFEFQDISNEIKKISQKTEE